MCGIPGLHVCDAEQPVVYATATRRFFATLAVGGVVPGIARGLCCESSDRATTNQATLTIIFILI